MIEKQQILFGSEITDWNLHVSPVVRGLEFYAGMLLYPISRWVKNIFLGYHILMKYIVSLMEIAVTGIVIFLIISENNIWMRGDYVCFVY